MTKTPWGLDYIEQAALEQRRVVKEAQLKECQMYANVFGTADGQKILNRLKLILDAPTWPCDKDERYGYYREGQNDIIRHILNRIEGAR